MSATYKIISCDEQSEPTENIAFRYRLDVATCVMSYRTLAIVQLNPSTASSSKSDATVGKVSTWGFEHGFGRIIFLNLFAVRTPFPHDLHGHPENVLSDEHNERITKTALGAAQTVAFAWGCIPERVLPLYYRRLGRLRAILGTKRVFAIGEPTADGFPRHGRVWNRGNRFVRPFYWPL